MRNSTTRKWFLHGLENMRDLELGRGNWELDYHESTKRLKFTKKAESEFSEFENLQN